MARYISLLNWTEQGVRNAKETVKRAEAARQAFQKGGGKITDIYWTLGQYDVVVIFEAPDSESAYRLLMAIGIQGNVKSVTLQALDEKEMAKVIQGVG